MSFLFDSKFYISIPVWVYIVVGLGCIVNATFCCCYSFINKNNILTYKEIQKKNNIKISSFSEIA